ncbi:MAG: M67 family metallopeptidase [Acidobacteriota bacterium]
MALRIDLAAAAAIRAHGREAYPHECCGAMYGGDGEVRDVLALPNVTAEGPRRRFRVSDGDYRAAEARAAALGLALVGFYHSHPDHPAEPSQYDLDHAWPNWSYVIVSVQGGQPADLRSWRLREDRSRFDEEALIV